MVPVHRWVPWIAGYSQAFTEDAINTFSTAPNQLVLDPFAGVGTTLVEADRLGHRAVGFEINPYAAFVTSVKLRAHRLDTQLLRETVDRLAVYGQRCETAVLDPVSREPDGFMTRDPFYSPDVLRKVLLVMDFIGDEEERNKDISEVVQLAFAATMVDYSNYSYEPSLGRKASAGRPEVTEFPVIETLVEKLAEIACDADWFHDQRVNPEREDATINQISFFEGYREVPQQSVNLMITSPPYMNNYHYNRNTRPHMYWLGFCNSPSELKPLEEQNFGSSWQLARDLDPVPLDPVINDREISDTLRRIREQNPDKGVNGGKGWANYATIYLNDCVKFMRGLQWVLNDDGTGLIVVGNSILQGIQVPTDQFMAKVARHCGLEVRSITTPREARVGNSIVNSGVRTAQAEQKGSLYESVIEVGQQR